MDESSYGDEALPRKRRRVETVKAIDADVELERFIALEAKSVLTPDVEAVSAAGAAMEKRPSEV